MPKLILSLLGCFVLISSQAQEPKFKATNNFPSMQPSVGFNAAFSNYKFKYSVQKKDSTVIIVKSKIIFGDDGRYYLFYKQKGTEDEDPVNRIYADQTIKISFEDTKTDQTITGIAKDNRWLFKVVSGKINLYSSYPPASYVTNEALAAFQVGDGPIEYLDPDKLRAAMEGSKKAIEILDKNTIWENSYVKAVEKFNMEQL